MSDFNQSYQDKELFDEQTSEIKNGFTEDTVEGACSDGDQTQNPLDGYDTEIPLKSVSDEKKPKKKRSVLAKISDCFLVLLTLVLIVLIVANLFFFQGYSVVGVSMKNTYQSGDKITVCKWKEPQRQDVVVIDRGDKFVIKRIIAFGGETVKIDKNGKVFINDTPLEEPYLDSDLIAVSNQDFVYAVEEGQVFYLGDNRKESDDSRNPKIGSVDEDTVVGVVSEFFTKIKDKTIYKKFLYYVFS